MGSRCRLRPRRSARGRPRLAWTKALPSHLPRGENESKDKARAFRLDDGETWRAVLGPDNTVSEPTLREVLAESGEQPPAEPEFSAEEDALSEQLMPTLGLAVAEPEQEEDEEYEQLRASMGLPVRPQAGAWSG